MTDEKKCPYCGATCSPASSYYECGTDTLRLDRTLTCSTGYIEKLEAERDGLLEFQADVRRIAREMDVAMCGEDGAAKQPSLCDIQASLKDLVAERDRLRAAGEDIMCEFDGICPANLSLEAYGKLEAALQPARKEPI